MKDSSQHCPGFQEYQKLLHNHMEREEACKYGTAACFIIFQRQYEDLKYSGRKKITAFLSRSSSTSAKQITLEEETLRNFAKTILNPTPTATILETSSTGTLIYD
jgi:hypothetical protein